MLAVLLIKKGSEGVLEFGIVESNYERIFNNN
jgi:hypothetical protein